MLCTLAEPLRGVGLHDVDAQWHAGPSCHQHHQHRVWTCLCDLSRRCEDRWSHGNFEYAQGGGAWTDRCRVDIVFGLGVGRSARYGDVYDYLERCQRTIWVAMSYCSRCIVCEARLTSESFLAEKLERETQLRRAATRSIGYTGNIAPVQAHFG